MLIDLSCPVENRGAVVKTNSETGESYVLLRLLNISEKTITSVEFNVLSYDSNGVELSKAFVELSELSAVPKAYFAENKAIVIDDIQNAKNFIIDVKKAVFEDGSIYEPSEENTVDTDDKEASVDDAISLRHFVPEAVCFAKEHSNYWKCVCGRPNFLDSEACVRCGRAKDIVLSNFSSRESLNTLFEEEKATEEKRLAEELEEVKIKKELKKKKTIKACIITLISLCVAAVLAVAGYFIYIMALNITADKALENGDYKKAFEYYLKTGNEKISEVTNFVQGNTPENLMFQSGLITADSENYYYLVLDNSTYMFNLVKENKKTGEKIVLTDAAGDSLNVSGDWIYFIDSENRNIKRVSKDGQTIETVLETPVYFLSVIADSIFYIKTDYDNPGNLSEEQCQTLASQGQMDMYYHLYRMDAESKKSKLIIEDNILTCAIYGDRILYLTNNEDPWLSYNLFSTDFSGKNIEVLVDTPVASFTLQGNELYYVKMYNDAYKGQEITDFSQLDYTLYCRNIETNETKIVNNSYMPIYTNISGDEMFLVGYRRDEYIAAQSGTAETAPTTSLFKINLKKGTTSQLVAGDIQVFNVFEDEIIAYIPAQGMCRLKTDGSNFKELTLDNNEAAEDLTEFLETSEETEKNEVIE